MPALNSSQFAHFVNSYAISEGPPRTIVIHDTNKFNLGALQDVTVNGTLLEKQFVRLNLQTNERHVEPPAGGASYSAEAGDGDLHFCLGDEAGKPHIACELQNTKAWVTN